MFDINNILEPDTIYEAINMLDKNENLKIIAGGTDVLIRLHHGKMSGADLLSIRKIKDLKEITINKDGNIEIGAMSCFSDIFRNEIIEKHIPWLGEAAVSMGGPQVRNMATIGGNVCNGAVSADSAPALFALNAKLKLISLKGERIVPIEEFYEGPGKVKLDRGEILKSIIIDKENYFNKTGHYIKFSNRNAMDISMLGVCAICSIKDNQFEDLRLSLGVAAPTPIRCKDAEKYAKGLDITEENIKAIGKEALKAAKARDSWRASKDFREHLIKELTIRAIEESIKMVGGQKDE